MTLRLLWGGLIMAFALFFNTTIGRWALIILYLTIFVLAWMLEIILLPFIVNLFLAASARRPFLFACAALIPSRGRRRIRDYGSEILTWWDEWSRLEQLFACALLVLSLIFLTLEAIEVTNVLLILPFPLFVSIFFKRELPHFILRYLARQGIDTFIFRGGWALASSNLRHWMKRKSTKFARFVIGVRRRCVRYAAALQPT